jgi:hypothetical protein
MIVDEVVFKKKCGKNHSWTISYLFTTLKLSIGSSILFLIGFTNSFLLGKVFPTPYALVCSQWVRRQSTKQTCGTSNLQKYSILSLFQIKRQQGSGSRGREPQQGYSSEG